MFTCFLNGINVRYAAPWPSVASFDPLTIYTTRDWLWLVPRSRLGALAEGWEDWASCQGGRYRLGNGRKGRIINGWFKF